MITSVRVSLPIILACLFVFFVYYNEKWMVVALVLLSLAGLGLNTYLLVVFTQVDASWISYSLSAASLGYLYAQEEADEALSPLYGYGMAILNCLCFVPIVLSL